MNSKGFATGIWTFGPCPDRFCVEGYKPPRRMEEYLDDLVKVKDLTGVMMHYPDPVDEQKAEAVRRALEERNLALASLDVDLFSNPQFARGSLMSPQPKIRKKAIEMTKRSLDLAEQLGSEVVNLWPGQDGFDYPFQIDYREQWDLLLDALEEVASYNPRVKLSLEYKLREPRTHSTIATSGVALFLSQIVQLPNVGVTIDLGHSLNCKESPANVVALLDKFKKLFVLHLNDNFRDWDDDMVVGTVHFWETLEFIYYLYHSDYQGWLGLDIFPYREDPVLACSLSIENIKWLLEVVAKIDSQTLRSFQKEGNALEALRYLKSQI